MKNVLKAEYYRIIKNKMTYVAMGINVFLVVLHFLLEILPYWNINSMGKMLKTYPLGLFEKWIGGESASVYPALYFMLAPLISAIPYGGSLQEDLKTGYVENVCTKVKKETYFMAKYIVAFSTSLITVIPLMLNFVLTAMTLPAIIPQSCGGFYTISASKFMGDLFYSCPLLYVLIFFLLNMIVWGLLATSSILVFGVVKSVYAAILMPFLVSMVLFGITQVSEYDMIAPLLYLQPSQPYPVDGAIIIFEIIVFSLGGLIYWYQVKKKEII